MCGLTGFFDTKIKKEEAKQILLKMSNLISHRGPDDHGIWFDENYGLGFAHRRLSILDLSSAGHQPMTSASHRFVIVFNGEIYNHLDLRKELEKTNRVAWRGHSDTETLLECFEVWGIEKTIKECIGMFAFAVFDKKLKLLTLGRDRLGEKPLYYGWVNDTLFFTSEIRALKKHPKFRNNIQKDVLSFYFKYSYIPAPFSIYEGINKVKPGQLISFNLLDKNMTPDMCQYWSVLDITECQNSQRLNCTPDEAVQQLEGLLGDAVKRQMLSDVPLGAFLSGGIDSSTIVALMQAQSSRKVKTFSIGFREEGKNEAEFAKAVAKHLGTAHTELYLSPKDILENIPSIPSIYDEPFADSSQIPTYLVARLAREKVTVALSGDGGDELFGGYERYLSGNQLWNRYQSFPANFKKTGALFSKGVVSLDPEKYFNSAKIKKITQSLTRLSDILKLDINNFEEFYQQVSVAHNYNISQLLNGFGSNEKYINQDLKKLDLENKVEAMMIIDQLTYLPDDILAKVDRAAMNVSLETRVPLLDHKVVEFALSLPIDYKIRNGQTKWVLRQVLQKYIPNTLIDRPKMGFGMPIGNWLKDVLKDWVESLIDVNSIKEEGFLNPVTVQQIWHEHLSGKRDWSIQLWDILMFQSWLKEEKNNF